MPIRQWSGSAWEIALEENFLSIKAKGLDQEIPFDNSVTLGAKRGWFRWQLFSNHGLQLKLKGASRYEARLIALSIQLSQSRSWLAAVDLLITWRIDFWIWNIYSSTTLGNLSEKYSTC